MSSTQSKALLMLMETTAVQVGGLGLLKPLAILVEIRRRAEVQERKGMKPCCLQEGVKEEVR